MIIFSNKAKILGVIAVISIAILMFFGNNRLGMENNGNDRAGAAKTNTNAQEEPYYKDLTIENIHINDDNSVYSLNGGRIFQDGEEMPEGSSKEKTDSVVRVALFYQWMKEDPLLFSSGLNVDRFEKALEMFSEEQDKLFKFFPEVKGNILPVSFLKSYSDSSRRYREFSSRISEENALLLLNSIEKTNENYYAESTGLREVLKRSISDEGISENTKILINNRNFTTPGIILADLSKTENNSKAIEADLIVRKKCLLESSRFCERPFEAIREPDVLTIAEKSVPEFKLKELIMKENIEYRGPYKIDSQCWEDGKEQYMYYAVKACPRDLNCSMTETRLATDIYFIKLNDYFPFHIKMKEKGLVVMPQNIANTYTCTNLEYKPIIATLDYFYREYKDSRLFEKFKSDNAGKYSDEFMKIIEEGDRAEKMFFDSKYPAQEEMDYLGNYYAFAYSYSIKNNVGDIESRNDLLGRYLIIKEKMADIDLILNEMTFYFAKYVFENDEAKKSIPSSYLYAIRSGYSFSFLNFSGLVWRIPERPKYLETSAKDLGQAGSEKEIYNYQEAVSEFGKENIEKWIKIYDENIGMRIDL